jgi:hypothetical protein
MIKINISIHYPHQYLKYQFSDKDLYISDYTNQTQHQRGVEILDSPPSNIQYLSIINSNNLETGYIDFDNSSFTYGNNIPRSQCECVLFPNESTNNSWILFCELKYCSEVSNQRNINKAIKQLYRTRYYYFQRNIFLFTNTSYLIVSLPKQRPPFLGFAIPPNFLTKLKSKRNTVLKFDNKIEIKNKLHLI